MQACITVSFCCSQIRHCSRALCTCCASARHNKPNQVDMMCVQEKSHLEMWVFYHMTDSHHIELPGPAWGAVPRHLVDRSPLLPERSGAPQRRPCPP